MKLLLLSCSIILMTFFEVANAGEPQTSDPHLSTTAGLGDRPIQQVAITSRDLKRSINYYRDQLGLSFLFESNNMAFFDMAGVRLMIAYDPQRPTTKPTSIIYFDVENFHAAVERLKDMNVELDGSVETVQRQPKKELKIQQFHDPDGNALALMGYVDILN